MSALSLAVCPTLSLRLSAKAVGAWIEGLLTLARKMNGEFPVPLSDSEVRETWRSVCRYRVTWRRDGHAPWWLARQSRLATLGGNASGVVRRAGTVLEHDRAPWVKLGI